MNDRDRRPRAVVAAESRNSRPWKQSTSPDGRRPSEAAQSARPGGSFQKSQIQNPFPRKKSILRELTYRTPVAGRTNKARPRCPSVEKNPLRGAAAPGDEVVGFALANQLALGLFPRSTQQQRLLQAPRKKKIRGSEPLGSILMTRTVLRASRMKLKVRWPIGPKVESLSSRFPQLVTIVNRHANEQCSRAARCSGQDGRFF